MHTYQSRHFGCCLGCAHRADISTTAASYLELGEFNIVLAMAIALTKVSLVAWIFMGVRYSTSLTRLFCIAGLVWLVIMMILTSSDYVTRGWQYQGQPWSHSASGGDSR